MSSIQEGLEALGDIVRGETRQDELLDYEPTPQDLLEYTTPSGYDVIERYWVNRPFAFISVLYNKQEEAPFYQVIEPKLTDFEHELLAYMLEDVRDRLIHSEETWDEDQEEYTFRGQAERTEIANAFKDIMVDLLAEYGIEVEPSIFYKVYYYIWRTFIGYGRLDPMIRDQYIEDISCDGYGIPIYLYHENYNNVKTNVKYGKQDLDSFVIALGQEAGKNISLEKPHVSGTIEDGSRIELSYGTEVTQKGSTYTIRKFSEDPFTPIDLINFGTFTIEQMAYLWLVIEHKKSLIFAGGTASGKTTSMNAVSMFLPPRSKVVSIEDTPEINLHHENWIPSVTREGAGITTELDMYELLRSTLRQRPEYIIVGEVRGEEALTLFQAMNTGHTVYSTLHAESAQTAIRRMENPPINVPRAMFEGLDIISVQILTQVEGERVRRTNTLVEIRGIDDRTNDINFVELFEWDPETDDIVQPANSQVLQDIATELGSPIGELRRELNNRKQVLKHLYDNNVTNYQEFTEMVYRYYADPDAVLADTQRVVSNPPGNDD